MSVTPCQAAKQWQSAWMNSSDNLLPLLGRHPLLRQLFKSVAGGQAVLAAAHKRDAYATAAQARRLCYGGGSFPESNPNSN